MPCPTRSSTSSSASSAARWGPGSLTDTSTGSSSARALTPTGPGSGDGSRCEARVERRPATLCLAIGNEKARETRKKVQRGAEEAQSTAQQEVQNQGLTNQ